MLTRNSCGIAPPTPQLTVCLLVVYTLNFSLCERAEQVTHYCGLAALE